MYHVFVGPGGETRMFRSYAEGVVCCKVADGWECIGEMEAMFP